MRRILLQLVVVMLLGSTATAQEDISTIRTYDGMNNNLSNPFWGSAGENLLRLTDVGYGDGMSTMAGSNRPNPRNVSNVLFAQDGLRNDVQGLSDYCWVFGQFLDHDIGITPDGNEPAFIEVPRGDEWFDPARDGRAIIPMMRNIFDPASGDSPDNPRQHPNLITAYIDGSAVYGSDEERADWLRTFEDGKLKVSAGDLLPYNTDNGEVDGEVDHSAPEMDNPVGLSEKLFVAGDVRANENPLLAAFHTIFVREHNRVCEELIIEHPDWTDEELYQHARKIVGGLIQSIVYHEWLPVMGVNLPEYQGYDPSVNPQLMNVFTAAAFRLGHTLLNGNIMRLGENGEVMPDGNMTLRDAFFNPFALPESGLDPFLRGMAAQVQQGMDAKVIDDVRNFLFGAPGAGGLDLASININRGRERGLPDYNTVRKNFGLKAYRVFPEINSDINVHARLFVLYRSVNWVDPWVGMLAEKPLRNSLFGETITKIMEVQFNALRDGDRFYFENDPVLSPEEKQMIKDTKFSDIIMRNTGIEIMQPNVFKATSPDEICPVMPEFVITVNQDNGDPIAGVEANMDMEDEGVEMNQTGDDGTVVFEEMNSCDMQGFQLNKEDLASNGVSTADLIVLQRHILGLEILDSPYKLLAADVNNSGSLTTLDLIHMRNVILAKERNFPSNVVWTFIPADYTFDDPTNPFDEDFQANQMSFEDTPESNYTFIGVKEGDIDNSVRGNNLASVEVRSNESLMISVEDKEIIAGNTYEAIITVNDLASIEGYQFGLNYDNSAIELSDIASTSTNLPGISANNFAIFEDLGLITTSWNTFNANLPEKGTFNITFTAIQSGRLSDYLSLNSNITSPEAYRQHETIGVELEFKATTTSVDQFVLYQNEPNPFTQNTLIRFDLPESSEVTITVFDASGRTLFSKEQFFDRGTHTLNLTKDELSATGLLYYEVTTENAAVTKKMTVVK